MTGNLSNDRKLQNYLAMGEVIMNTTYSMLTAGRNWQTQLKSKSMAIVGFLTHIGFCWIYASIIQNYIYRRPTSYDCITS